MPPTQALIDLMRCKTPEDFAAHAAKYPTPVAAEVHGKEPIACSETRDMEKNPYTPDEARVAKYLMDLTGIGGGDDPIGFLLASHRILVDRGQRAREAFQQAHADNRLAGLPDSIVDMIAEML